MSVKKIIQESIDKNPLGVKEALEEALQDRVRAALEEKYAEMMESKDEDDDEVELDEAWSDGVSSRRGPIHARTAAQYRKKAKDFASRAKSHPEGSSEHNKHMANHHSAMAKSIKSSYHAGQYGTMNMAKKDHKAQMAKAKEYKSMKESFDLSEDTMHADIDHMGGHDAMAKKHNISLASHKHGTYAVGKKKDLQKYLVHHYYGDHGEAKDLHPEVFKESFDLSDLTIEELEDFIMSEDFDQLDEISKSTVKSYASKAWKDAGKAYDKENYGRGDKRMAGYSRALGKLGTKGTSTFQRGGGTPDRVKVKATDRLAKESFDLDEGVDHYDWKTHHDHMFDKHNREGNDHAADLHLNAKNAHSKAINSGSKADSKKAIELSRRAREQDKMHDRTTRRAGVGAGHGAAGARVG